MPRIRGETTRALAIFVVAALPRALGAHLLADGAAIAAGTDAVQYDELARAFLGGAWWSTPLVVREPGYPVFLALAYALPGPELLLRHILQTMLGAGTPVLLYIGLRGLLNERVRFLAALATAANVHLIYYAALPLRENLTTFLIVATLVGFLRAFHNRSMRTLVAATGGLSLLVHTDARFLPLLVGLPILGRLAGGTWAWRSTAIAWAITGLLLIPYTVRNVVATGRPVILTGRALGKWAPRAFGQSNDPSIDASGDVRAHWLANWERDKHSSRVTMTEPERTAFDGGTRPATGVGAVFGARWIEYWRFARTKPGYLPYPDGRLAPTWSRRHHIANALTIGPILVLLPFFLVGANANERRTLLAIAAFVASHALLHALVHARERYRVPVEPWLAVLAASAAMGLVSAVRRRSLERTKVEALSRSA